MDHFDPAPHIFIGALIDLAANFPNLCFMSIVVFNAGQFLYYFTVCFFALIFERHLAKVRKNDLHCAGVGKDNQTFGGIGFVKEIIDLLLDLNIFPDTKVILIDCASVC